MSELLTRGVCHFQARLSYVSKTQFRKAIFTPLKPNGYYLYPQVYHPKIPRSSHAVYVFCVDLRNKIVIIQFNWLVSVTDTECLLRGTFCPHNVFMCFVWIWEQTAIISLYSINWLVFITKTECLLRGTFCPHSICVLCGSENKQRLFHCTALTDWFL
jgi:hypothetical protein